MSWLSTLEIDLSLQYLLSSDVSASSQSVVITDSQCMPDPVPMPILGPSVYPEISFGGITVLFVYSSLGMAVS